MTGSNSRNHSILTTSLGVAMSAFAPYLMKRPWAGFLFSNPMPAHLAIQPLDLNLADPSLAHEFYHGRFALAGRIIRTGAVSPWQVEPPSRAWEEALHDFGWLRHMSAAKTAIARAHARILVDEWITSSGKKINHPAWTSHVVARRIISWISHADMLLAGAEASFRRRFLKNLGLNIRYLRLLRPFWGKRAQKGMLDTHIALTFAALALPSIPAHLRAAELRLQRALDAHILPDGGHISRNPALLIPILADMVSLCHCYQQKNLVPPPHFLDVLERIDRALRFFQHRDQSLANFNGVGPLLPERAIKLLNIHATTAPPPLQLADSAYQRLACGATTVIVDSGCPPRGRDKFWSRMAHAGCLSFEMSSGAHLFVVNCGIDPASGGEFQFFGRLTAAHSTATLNDTSSCHFRHGGRADAPIDRGPDKIRIKQIENEDCLGLVACHNGYGRDFNLLHQRSIALSKDGNLLQGADRFVTLDPKRDMGQMREPIMATVRFHLHPDVEVSQLDGNNLRLEVMRADVWTLTCQAEMALEDSIYFSGLHGPTRTRQIVFSFNPGQTQEIYWAFARQLHPHKPASCFRSPTKS